MTPYAPTTLWRYRLRNGSYERVSQLALYWEAEGDCVSDDYHPDDDSAEEVFDVWRRYLYHSHNSWDDRLGEGWVPIWWFVTSPDGEGTFEAAPFTRTHKGPKRRDDFLTFYTWPEDASTGEPLNFLRLPVVDKLWCHGRKGGFIQEYTGWKPSAFQSAIHFPSMMELIGR